MTLKSKNPEQLHDPWSGPWGEVVPDKKSLTLLQVVLPAEDGIEKSYGFTYKSFTSWSRQKAEEQDVLVLKFGTDKIKIEGRSLDIILISLEEGRLKRLQCCSLQSIPHIEKIALICDV